MGACGLENNALTVKIGTTLLRREVKGVLVAEKDSRHQSHHSLAGAETVGRTLERLTTLNVLRASIGSIIGRMTFTPRRIMAIIVTINNSYSKILGLTQRDADALAQVLSYKVDTTYSYDPFAATRKYLLSRTGEFPTGLLYLVKKYIKENSLQVEYNDKRRCPKDVQSPPRVPAVPTPYPYQQKGLRRAIRACRGTLSMVTGSGKSLLMALIVAELNLRTLIIVTNLGLIEQLTDSFREIFGSLDNITIENIDSKNLKKHAQYDCLIVDESHHVAAKTYQKLNRKYWTGIFYRFFFTATPYRGVADEQILMEGVSGEVIHTVDYHQAVRTKTIVPVEAFYIDLPKQVVKGSTWAQVYSELVVNNVYRNKLIAKWLDQLRSNRCVTLCLVKEIKHGINILKECKHATPFAKGDNEDNKDIIKRLGTNGHESLVATEGVFAEGMDSKSVEYVILSGLGKSKSAFLQKVGRGVRRYKDKNSAKIIIFKDSSHKFTLRHFRAQCKILKEVYGISPIKLEVS